MNESKGLLDSDIRLLVEKFNTAGFWGFLLNEQTTTQRDKELCLGKKCCENFWFGGYVKSAEEKVYIEKRMVFVCHCVSLWKLVV